MKELYNFQSSGVRIFYECVIVIIHGCSYTAGETQCRRADGPCVTLHGIRNYFTFILLNTVHIMKVSNESFDLINFYSFRNVTGLCIRNMFERILVLMYSTKQRMHWHLTPPFR